jgi:hypothetical protein
VGGSWFPLLGHYVILKTLKQHKTQKKTTQNLNKKLPKPKTKKNPSKTHPPLIPFTSTIIISSGFTILKIITLLILDNTGAYNLLLGVGGGK